MGDWPVKDLILSEWFLVGASLCGILIGIICIGLLIRTMRMIKDITKAQTTESPQTAVNTATYSIDRIENREEIIAAVSAAVAEELGTDISAIRILSFKKI